MRILADRLISFCRSKSQGLTGTDTIGGLWFGKLELVTMHIPEKILWYVVMTAVPFGLTWIGMEF